MLLFQKIENSNPTQKQQEQKKILFHLKYANYFKIQIFKLSKIVLTGTL